MKAWVLHNIGDIRMETVREPEPGEGEALVAVKAAGICGSDIPRIYRTGAYSHPLILGHEFSGIVQTVGKGTDKRWEKRRVGVFPLIPCGTCRPCREKAYEMCRHYSYLGSRRDGGFAEYVAVPERNLIELPDKVSYEEAAMLEPMAVAVHAMRRAAPQTDHAVAVYGMGTIGTLLLMFLLEAGIKNIYAIGNKEFQRQTALRMGIPKSHYCDSREGQVGKWLMEHTGHSGAEVFFECIGRNATVAQTVELTAPGGKVCLVGNPDTDMLLEKKVYWKILRNQLSITGTWNSSFLPIGERGACAKEDDWHYALKRLEHKRVAPECFISHRLVMGELAEGLRIMRDKTEDYMKIMMGN